MKTNYLASLPVLLLVTSAPAWAQPTAAAEPTAAAKPAQAAEAQAAESAQKAEAQAAEPAQAAEAQAAESAQKAPAQKASRESAQPTPEEASPEAQEAKKATDEPSSPQGSLETAPSPEASSKGAISEKSPSRLNEAQVVKEPSVSKQFPTEVPINPRPEGEKELLGKHQSDDGSYHFKPGTGFVFETKDKLFSLGIRTRVQFRNETLVTDKENEDGDLENSVANTFGIRRARVQFKGHMWGKHNKYKAELAFSPKDLGLKPVDLGRVDSNPKRSPLLSWYSEHTQIRDISLRMGQYKLPYSRQRVVSSGNLAFVDRSEAQREFNLDRDIGAHLFSKDFFGLELFKYYAGASLGEGRDVWESEDLTDSDNTSYQLYGRVEALPFGKFKDYSEVDFVRSNRVRMSLGAAYAYLRHGRRERGYQGGAFEDGGTVDYQNMTADVLLKWAGLSVFSEFFWRKGVRNDPVADGDNDNLARNGLGGTLQADYLIPGMPMNVGARFSTVTDGAFEGERTSIASSSEAGGGLGWFFAGHPLKLQADYFHLWGDEFAPGGAERVRVQMQVAY